MRTLNGSSARRISRREWVGVVTNYRVGGWHVELAPGWEFTLPGAEGQTSTRFNNWQDAYLGTHRRYVRRIDGKT